MSQSIIPGANYVDEDLQTTLPKEVLQRVTNEEIEQQILDTRGKIEITQHAVIRTMPVCHRMSAAGGFLIHHISSQCRFQGCVFTTGTDATKFETGELLSPDLSVFTPERLYNVHTATHLYSAGPAPHLVAEVVWDTEVNQPTKGLPKVLNQLFTVIGTNGTQIEEGWVLVIARVSYPTPHTRTRSYLDAIPIIGPIISIILILAVQAIFSPLSGTRSRHLSGLYGVWTDTWAQVGRWIVYAVLLDSSGSRPRACRNPLLGSLLS